jgi:hypothetical protein
MPTNTYVELRKETISSATDTVTFSLSGISGYADLRIVVNGALTSGTANLLLRYNGDSTSTLYSATMLTGDTSTATSFRSNAANSIILNYYGYMDTGFNTSTSVDIFQYAGSNLWKTNVSRANNADNGVAYNVGLWRNTSAITSVTILTGGGNFANGTTLSLYGIATAPATTVKASGGTITSASDGYIYHTFTGSGAFVPSTNLTNVDYLVVAGGGGGSNTGAGGGAGGLRSTMYQTGGGGELESKLSLTSGTSYTVTIGGGGAGDSASAVGENSVFGSITALGGGCGGGNQAGKYNGVNGGSGGGARSDTGGTAGTGTTGQGFAGSVGLYGAGGGAGGVGESPGNDGTGTRGGIGAYLPVVAAITGTGVGGYYAGGGSGISSGRIVPGGLGGGGNGALYPGQGENGTANTGGGGGASSNSPFATGGSGIVIIRYQG